MTKSPEFVERAGERLAPEDFVEPAYRAIFETLLDEPELRVAPSGMDVGAAQRLQELLADPQEVGHAAEVFRDSVARIRSASLDRRIQELDRRLKLTGDEGEKRALIEEKVLVVGERRALGPDDWTMTARRLRAGPNPNEADR
jgi:replicative DNA helicase